jgi:hypothetical protein
MRHYPIIPLCLLLGPLWFAGSAAADRTPAAPASTAVKSPCVAVAAVNITLSGLQSIGGAALARGDRVLVTAQTSPIDNGIYIADTRQWRRAADFHGAGDAVNGTLVVVPSGVGLGVFYQVLGANPIVPGTSPINFVARDNPNLAYPKSPAEITASDTVVNYGFAPGVVDRYGVNNQITLPDMGPAEQAAIDQMLAGGSPVRFLNGAYSIVTLPTFGAPTNRQIPIDIGGQGLSTQIINNARAGSGFTFTLPSGAYLHDLLLTGNSAHKNGGVLVDGTTTAAIRWRIERVYSLTPGIGFEFKNTNSGVIRDCWHWADNAPILRVPQTVTPSDIGHGIYATGGFVHDVSIYDFQGGVSRNYASGQRWIKNDATNSLNFRIRGGLAVNESPGNSQKLLELGNAAGGSHIFGSEVTGIYHESGFLEFNDVAFSNIQSLNNGGVVDKSGVGLSFNLNSIANVIGANSESGGSLTFDRSSGGNIVMAGAYAAYGDLVTSSARNTYLTAYRSASNRGVVDNTLTYSASMTPNMLAGSLVRIVATDSTPFTINAPLNASSGGSMTLVILNTSGGALGTITWNSVFKLSTWTSPAKGFNRSISFVYDGAHWVESSQVGVDVPN